MTATANHNAPQTLCQCSTNEMSDRNVPQQLTENQWDSRLQRLEDSRGTPVWIHLRDTDDIRRDLERQRARVIAGEDLSLPCMLVAVKDNIDVAAIPTTAACPAYQYTPTSSAPAVQRLVDAGAVVVGKTNMDAFATGLVGTRSPYGVPSSVLDPALIPGGSSSGSAVAVALCLADIGLGTDTAGSGRVPAVFNGIVGLKPTKGYISTTGIVPAAESFDAVSVFARSVAGATRAVQVMATGDVPVRRCAAPQPSVVGVPCDENLAALSPEYAESFALALSTAKARGLETVQIDMSGLLNAARLLYDGALVAERYAAVGEFIDSHPDDVDQTVAKIIQSARDIPAHRYLEDRRRINSAREELDRMLERVDSLLLPVTTEHPSIAEVSAAPRTINARLGTFTNFANLLSTSACAVPMTHEGRGGFGVMVVGGHGDDQVVVDLAARLADEEPRLVTTDDGTLPLAVFGAHLRGMPLHHQLDKLGARYVGEIETAPHYRMVALNTVPLKPGVAEAFGEQMGTMIPGELYLLTPETLARFLVSLPAPMSLTQFELADGQKVTGFTSEPAAYTGGEDITEYGGWRAYVQHLTRKAGQE